MATSIYKQILDEVKVVINAIGLNSVDNADIIVQKIPDLVMRDERTILITPHRKETMDFTQGSNTKDDIVYPVAVRYYSADNRDQFHQFCPYLLAREKIGKAFRHQPLDNVTCVHYCYTKPLRIVDCKEWNLNGRYVSGVLLLFVSRESRGN